MSSRRDRSRSPHKDHDSGRERSSRSDRSSRDDDGRDQQDSRSRRERRKDRRPKEMTDRERRQREREWLERRRLKEEEEARQAAIPKPLVTDDMTEDQMMAAMGLPVAGFNTTKNKHVEDKAANQSAVNKKTTRRYRQYMNRKVGQRAVVSGQ